MVQWDEAAVIIALIFGFTTMSPITIGLLRKSARSFATLLWPPLGRCSRVLWNDIPQGLLYDPNDTSQSSDLGYESLIRRAFNRASTKPARKPLQWPLLESCVQTDVRTLKTLILISSIKHHTTDFQLAEPKIRILDRGMPAVQLESPENTRTDSGLTKLEIDAILKGYPPFYRQKFYTVGGVLLDSPISHPSHIDRGGWVLAVGMILFHPEVPPLHNMSRITEEKVDSPWKATQVMDAFRMIGYALKSLEKWESRASSTWVANDEHIVGGTRLWSAKALEFYEVIMHSDYSLLSREMKTVEMETCELFVPLFLNSSCLCVSHCLSGAPHAESCRRGQHKRKDPAKLLNKEQCIAALEIFNNYTHSEANLNLIEPVLPAVLQTMILGMCEVEHYFSRVAKKLNFPEELETSTCVYVQELGH